MLPDLKLVVRLQELDNRVTELTREISALPRHISEIEKKLLTHERKLEADRAALAANLKDRKRMEAEIQAQEQKISKLKDQMLGAKTNEVYRAFQSEIDFCEKEIHRAEDGILEAMSESEPLERNVNEAETALKAERAQVEAESHQARARTSVDQKAVDELLAERKRIVASVNAAVSKKYENIRKHRRGIAVSEALEGRCSTCNIAMRLQFFQDLKKGDEIMTCESCGRILYYNPPAAVEDLTGESAPLLEQ